MFRLVKQKGVVFEAPAFVKVYASGTIRPGGVVQFREVSNKISPVSSSTTYTTIFGIALDYTQGTSDSQVRVVPFVQGQLWAADCANTPNTAHLMIKHAVTTSGDNRGLTVINTSYDQTAATGLFIAYGIHKTTLIGEFVRVQTGDQFSNQWTS